MKLARSLFRASLAALWVTTVSAQSAPAAPKPAAAPAADSDHLKKDITRHRAMAQAHEAAARCFEAGKGEDLCIKELQASCKGLAIGKYCGMRHEH
jgi:hypothetical protein